jgi:HSP20 family protein
MEGERIRKLRLQFGLSQERFARLLGVSLQTVRRWESGLTRPLPIMSLKLEELQRQISKEQRKKGGVTMSEKRKPGEEVEFSLGGLFRGIGSLFDLVSKMTEEGKEEYSRTGKVDLGGKAKGVYGFSVKVGLGGKPVIEQFGNIKRTEKGSVEVAEVQEPIVDVFDEGDHLMVIAELPGVEESDIHLEIKGDILGLKAEGRDRKYSKEVLLPSEVEADSMETQYKTGILEIKLAKRAPGSGGGR